MAPTQWYHNCTSDRDNETHHGVDTTNYSGPTLLILRLFLPRHRALDRTAHHLLLHWLHLFYARVRSRHLESQPMLSYTAILYALFKTRFRTTTRHFNIPSLAALAG